jgi:hypothetical protein
MLDQTFTLKNLLAVRKKIDGSKFGQTPRAAKSRLEKLANSLANGTFAPAQFGRRTIKSYSVYSTSSYENTIVLRKLNDNLRRLYKLHQSDRTRIVKQVALLLAESCPKSVLRLDIKSFYDAVNRQQLLRRIGDDSLLSPKSKSLLLQFLSGAFPGLGEGLPRGVNLSASLAEFALRDFDQSVKALPGVYFYARYVDDIIVFTIHDPIAIKQSIESILPHGLELNEKKTTLFTINGCRCEDGCVCGSSCRCISTCRCKETDGIPAEFDFLGYKFKFSSIAGKEKRRAEIFISMADKKVAKTKTRIVRSLLDYARNRDFVLLRDRLRFLTANHSLTTSNVDQKVKSGVYYSYRLLTLIEDSSGRLIPPIIRELDHFLRAALFASNNAFGRKLSAALSPTQKQSLQMISFTSGFISKRLARIPAPRIKQLKECWDE